MLNRKRMYIIIGSKLNAMRQRHFIPTTEASVLFGIPVERYVQYELGKPIPLDLLFQIAQWYGCEISELMPTIKECEVFWCFSSGESVQGGNRFKKVDGIVMKQIGQAVPVVAERTGNEPNE